MEKYEFIEYTADAVVVGAGHAGCEAALALARTGLDTVMLTLNLDSIGFMPCNPSIGGTAKGHLVREIDALGGEMGLNADKTALQLRMLNVGKGAAVQSLRAQSDKNAYHREMKRTLEHTDRLRILQGEAAEILVEDGKCAGVKTAYGGIIRCRAVVLCTGVYLNSETITGSVVQKSGPNGFSAATALTDNLIKLGFHVRRFKTGTPARLDGRTIDYEKCERQDGDEDIYPFSFLSPAPPENKRPCYLTYTNAHTHEIILSHLDRSPLYNGTIQSTGPRYCPSIETKVVRFKDKERHQIFLEPEGEDTLEIYVQGMSTSMPHDVQRKMYASVAGLERADIVRYGYAIEYDCIDTLDVLPTLEFKKVRGIYTAGQINGTSGYEEAAAQGLMAGLNASLKLRGLPPFTLRRDEAYIGVLIDDLVTKGTDEPYRMMTSRAEHRIFLRQDNADFRLTEKGRACGLVTNAQGALRKTDGGAEYPRSPQGSGAVCRKVRLRAAAGKHFLRGYAQAEYLVKGAPRPLPCVRGIPARHPRSGGNRDKIRRLLKTGPRADRARQEAGKQASPRRPRLRRNQGLAAGSARKAESRPSP